MSHNKNVGIGVANVDRMSSNDKTCWWVRPGVELCRENDLLRFGLSQKGEIHREQPARQTIRVKLNEYCFIKKHFGVGWRELWKNWISLKKPVIGAENEFRAYRLVEKAGLAAPRVLAFARSKDRVSIQKSMLITRELTDYISIESLVENHPDLISDKLIKSWLIENVARFASFFHGLGIVHRDFYICHILINEQIVEYLRRHKSVNDLPVIDLPVFGVMDLHRAELFDDLPTQWRVRDLGALLFSVDSLGFSKTDLFRFRKVYEDPQLSEKHVDLGIWEKVARRAETLRQREYRQVRNSDEHDSLTVGKPVKKVLQVWPTDYEPFGTLMKRWQIAADELGVTIETVVLSDQKYSDVDGVTYVSKKTSGNSDVLRKLADTNWDLIFCHRFRSLKTIYKYDFDLSRTYCISHGYDMFEHYKRRLWWRLRPKLSCPKHGPTLGAVSPALVEDMNATIPSSNKYCMLIPNVIDADEYQRNLLSRADAREALGLGSQDRVIGVVGRITQEKRPLLARDIYQQLNSDSRLKLLFLGEETSSGHGVGAELEAEGIIFAGKKPNAYRFMKAFDVLLVTSIAEGFSMVALEAMQAGTPVVCLSGGGPTYVLSELGFYVETDELDEWVRQVKKALDCDRERYESEGTKRLYALFAQPVLTAWLSSKLSHH